jgi:hypothetical protein
MEIGEAHAFRVEGVEVRRLDDRIAVGGDFAVALVVGDDQDDTGICRPCPRLQPVIGGPAKLPAPGILARLLEMNQSTREDRD